MLHAYNFRVEEAPARNSCNYQCCAAIVFLHVQAVKSIQRRTRFRYPAGHSIGNTRGNCAWAYTCDTIFFFFSNGVCAMSSEDSIMGLKDVIPT